MTPTRPLSGASSPATPSREPGLSNPTPRPGALALARLLAQIHARRLMREQEERAAS